MCKRNCKLFWWITFLSACSPIEKTPIVEDLDNGCFLYHEGKKRYPEHDPHYGEFGQLGRGFPKYGMNELYLERFRIECHHQIQKMLDSTTTGPDI